MIEVGEKNISRKENISVEFLYNKLKDRIDIELKNNDTGFSKIISENNLHRPGLALAGFVELFTYNRIQIFGNTEIKYLEYLSPEKRYKALEIFFSFNIPCVMVTDGNEPSKEMIELCNKNNVCIFTSKYSTTKFNYIISDFLYDQFASKISLHGSFVDVYGIGMLFTGKSGIGKSEVALDLVERGHRLVADDVVILTKKGEGILIGSGTDLVKHFMEVRGIGIIDIKSMFGVRAIRFQKRLEVIIELEIWDDKAEYTRTGLDDEIVTIGDVEIPYIKLPIVPGKNLTVVAEVIAMNYLLKHYGYDAAKVFQKNLLNKIKNKNESINRTIDYFENDFE